MSGQLRVDITSKKVKTPLKYKILTWYNIAVYRIIKATSALWQKTP